MKLRVEFVYPEPTRSPSPRKTNVSDSSRSDIASAGNSSSEAIFSELQTLRKKYDAVVEYTVQLTAERDTIVSQLEDAKRSKKTPLSPRKGERVMDKKVVQGFSLLSLLVVALLSFVAGKYLKLP